MFKIRVTSRDNGTYTVTCGLRTVVAWERKFRTKASQMANGMGIEDMAYLAYEGSKEAGIVVPIAFDDFINDLIEVDVVEDEPAHHSQAAPSHTS